MTCQDLTQKITSLMDYKKSFGALIESPNIPDLKVLQEKINLELIETLAEVNSYSAKIMHRKLVAEKNGFQYVTEFHEGLAWARKGMEVYLVNAAGAIIKKMDKVDTVSNFVNGFALVAENDETDNEATESSSEFSRTPVKNSYFLVDRHGEKISEPFASWIQGDLNAKIICAVDDAKASESNPDGTFFVRRDGSLVEGFVPLTPFAENRAWVKVGEREAQLIDENFNLIGGPVNADSCSVFINGVSLVRSLFDLRLYDKDGQLLHIYNDVQVWLTAVPDRLWIWKNGKTKLTDFSLNNVYFECPGTLNYRGDFAEDLAPISQNGVEDDYFMDENGRKVLPQDETFYQSASNFSEGFAAVYLRDKAFFINPQGEIVSGPFDRAEDYREGVAMVELNGKHFHIDRTGRKVFREL